MKKNIFNRALTVLALASSISTLAQSQQKHWSIPTNQVSFNTGSPVVSMLPGSTAPYGYDNYNQVSVSNSMTDANGNLLFFVARDVNDNGYLKVFDKYGNVIKDVNGNTELKFDYTWKDAMGIYHTDYGYRFNNWAEEISIVQVPGNCNQYYIITGYVDEHNLLDVIEFKPTYAKLDLSLSTNGALIAASSTSNLFDLTTGLGTYFAPYSPHHRNHFGIAVTPFRAETGNQNNFLYVYSNFNTTTSAVVLKYNVDASGITFVNAETPTLFSGSGLVNYYSEMEVVKLPSGDYRVAKAREDNSIWYCDFDYATGSIISGTEKMVSLGTGKSVQGLEFSPDGNYLYYSYHGTINKLGFLANLSSGITPAPADWMSYNAGFMEIGYDGRLYCNIIDPSGNYLVSKTVPNLPGSGFWNISAGSLSADIYGEYPYMLPDQVDGQFLFAGSPTISGNNFACSTGAETYTLGGAYDPTIYYTWTITGGTPSTYYGTSQTLPITWNTASGGVISVQAGCSAPSTFTAQYCCRYTGTVASGVTVTYLNNKTESIPVTYSGASSIIVINGVYNVNTNAVTYNNVPTYLAPNATVNINAAGYLKIQSGTTLQAGCGAMWNGIVVTPSANLLVDASTIQDAKLAIDSKGGAPFTISNNSKLNANYRNILIETYSLTHPAVIKASTISCLNASGLPANCLISPYIGKRTSTGIEINDNAQVNIGLDLVAQTNTFNNMDKGIVSARSGLRLYNNIFNNITYTGSGLGRCVVSTNNNAPSAEKLLVIGGTGFQANTFINSTFGIFATNNQDMSIIGNTFTNLGEAANMHYNTGVDNQLNFNNNIINDCSWGLHASGNEGSKSFIANNNSINTTIVTAKPNSTGISIENSALSALNAPAMTVNSNTINSVLTGIKITNATSPYVSLNKVSSLSDLGSSYAGNGILMTTCPSQITSSNTIQGAGSSIWYQNGIRVESSVNTRLLYNSVENIGRGLFFGGNCLGTETAKNHMMNNTDGFLVNYGNTGYQLGSSSACRATENKWEGSFTNHLYSYNSTGTTSLHYLYGSPVSTTFPGGSMYPLGIVSSASSGYVAIPYASCSNLSGYRLANPGADQWNEVADDQMTFAAFEETAKWMSKYDLYNMMKFDESFKTRTDLNNFAKEMSRTNIAKISELNSSLAGNTFVVASAEMMLNSINASNKVEQNYKDVFAALLNVRKGNDLNAKEVSKLKEIASQCPYEGGDAVYNARVILSMVNETVAVTDCEMPPVQSKLANSMIVNSRFEALTILPNPGNGLFTINTSVDDLKDIVVCDVMGKIVYSQTNVQDNTVKFDISGLSPGLYIVKLMSNGTVYSQKVIKQ